MDLVTLESQGEAFHFLNLFIDNAPLFDTFTHVGGVASVAKTLTDWYWLESGNKTNLALYFGPGLPDNYGGNELCLTLGITPGSYYFNDLKCYENYMFKFVCQTTVLV